MYTIGVWHTFAAAFGLSLYKNGIGYVCEGKSTGEVTFTYEEKHHPQVIALWETTIREYRDR